MQKNGKNLQFRKKSFCDMLFKIALQGGMLLQNYIIFYYFISTDIWPDGQTKLNTTVCDLDGSTL